MIRLVIVDDDPMVRMGLRLVLGGASELEIVGEAENGLDGEALVRDTEPDITLLDIRMPVQDGLVTTEHLLADPHPPAIIVLTTFDADELVLRALRAGAAGFLLKDTPPARLIESIEAVANGEPILSPTIMQRVITAATHDPDGDRDRKASDELATLTEREREVAVEVARGRSNAEIAAALYLSVATVKATLTHVFQKVGSQNRVQLAMKVRDAGLL